MKGWHEKNITRVDNVTRYGKGTYRKRTKLRARMFAELLLSLLARDKRGYNFAARGMLLISNGREPALSPRLPDVPGAFTKPPTYNAARAKNTTDMSGTQLATKHHCHQARTTKRSAPEIDRANQSGHPNHHHHHQHNTGTAPPTN